MSSDPGSLAWCNNRSAICTKVALADCFLVCCRSSCANAVTALCEKQVERDDCPAAPFSKLVGVQFARGCCPSLKFK